MAERNQSPQNRYENDPQYHNVCDAMEKLIHEAHLTPSEMRECAVLACIHYELRYGLNHYLQSVPLKVNEAFKTLSDFRKSETEADAIEREKANV